MGLQALFFYLFAFIAIASAFMVIWSKNPVHSVLFLILVFFNAAGLFLLLGAEFLAMILLVVYVGAVAVLFLFVVMMLDIDFTELRSGVLEYAPIGALIGVILAAELIVVVGGSVISPEIAKSVAMPIPAITDRTNTAALGDVLYTNYVYFFEIAGSRAAGRHDRGNRADAQASHDGQASEHCRPGCPQPEDRRRGDQGEAGAGSLRQARA
jgi:NADH-quinone oxidoreductase subunit J